MLLFKQTKLLFEFTMTDGESSDEEEELPTAARLPTQVRTTNSPFRKLAKVTQSKQKSSRNSHGGRDKSPGRRAHDVPVVPPPNKKKTQSNADE